MPTTPPTYTIMYWRAYAFYRRSAHDDVRDLCVRHGDSLVETDLLLDAVLLAPRNT